MYFANLILSLHKDTHSVVLEVSQNACILHSRKDTAKRKTEYLIRRMHFSSNMDTVETREKCPDHGGVHIIGFLGNQF